MFFLYLSASHRFHIDVPSKFTKICQKSNRTSTLHEKVSTLQTLPPNRIGTLHPNDKHQQVPPYFGANVPFWQSYLKTYQMPPNKERTWQEHFQAFASQVDRDNGVKRDELGGERNQDIRNEDTSEELEIREIRRNNDDNMERANRGENSNINKSNGDVDEISRRTDKVLQIDQDIENSDHIRPHAEKRNSTNQMTENNEQINTLLYRPNKYDSETFGDSGQTLQKDFNKEVDKENIPFNQLETNQMKELENNSKQRAWLNEHKETEEILPTINYTEDKLKGNFNIAREIDVSHDKNSKYSEEILIKETHDLRRNSSLDENKDEHDILDAVIRGDNMNLENKNTDNNDSNNYTDDDIKDTNKDNSVVEYNPAGSLLFQLQDSDESM